MVSSSPPRSFLYTYKPSRKKKIETTPLCVMDICTAQIPKIKSARMIISMTMFGTAFLVRIFAE